MAYTADFPQLLKPVVVPMKIKNFDIDHDPLKNHYPIEPYLHQAIVIVIILRKGKFE